MRQGKREVRGEKGAREYMFGLHACMCATCMSGTCEDLEEGLRAPGTGVPDSCELPDVGTGSSWARAAVLTAELHTVPLH